MIAVIVLGSEENSQTSLTLPRQDGSLVPSLYYLLNNKDMFSRVYVVNGDEAATTEPDMFRVILLVLEYSLFVGSWSSYSYKES